MTLLAGEGCGGRPATPISSLDDLNKPGMIIGGETETVSLRMGHDAMPQAKVASFATPADCYAALLAGRIDAVAYDRPPLDYAATQNDQYYVLPQSIGEGHIAVGAPLGSEALMAKINEFIALYRAEHTYEEMCNNWNGALKPVDPNSKSCYEDMYNRWVNTIDPPMPEIPAPTNPTNAGKPLIVGNDPQNIPMSFLEKNDKMSGFDSEFVMRFALWANLEYEFELLYYDALFPAIESKKLDFAVGNLDKTPERAETMLFSDDYIDCPAGVMILKSRWQGPDAAAEEDGVDAVAEVGALPDSV
ncbi:MAG: substrate-binding periplasmic protein [Thermoguttaceae bacterium]